MRQCEHCSDPLAPSTRSHARFCSDACRSAAWRKRAAAERLAFARDWLQRQTRALQEGDVEALAELTAEADRFFGLTEAAA
jgi:hypothetical protein